MDEAGVRSVLNAEEFKRAERDELARLGGYGPAAFPFYARILGDPSEGRSIVGRVLWVLAEPRMTGDRGPFLETAIAKLDNPDFGIRLAAVHLIGAIGAARDAPPVVAMLWDERSEVTWAAAKVLAAIGDRRAADAMRVWLERGNHRNAEGIRREVERCRADLLARLKKEEEAKKAKPPAK